MRSTQESFKINVTSDEEKKKKQNVNDSVFDKKIIENFKNNEKCLAFFYY